MSSTIVLATLEHDGPLGRLLLAASDAGLAGVWFEGQRHWPAAAAQWRQVAAHPVLQEAARQLESYWQGQLEGFALPLDTARGTPFQQRVWRALADIPRGATESYAALAQRIGAPGAARAVGAAVGRNPWSVVVPCHRVVGQGGALTGYAGGVARKQALLRLEGALA
jgi:methylated-DNA-[protein]-cysteine S-methyltransferase